MAPQDRTSRANVTIHLARRRILETIDLEPGLCLSDLGDRLGLSMSVVNYHVRLLERRRVLKTLRIGRFRRVVPGHWILNARQRQAVNRLAAKRRVHDNALHPSLQGLIDRRGSRSPATRAERIETLPPANS